MAAKYGKQKWTKGAQIDAPREKLPMLDWQWRDASGGGDEPYLTLTVCGVNREERGRRGGDFFFYFCWKYVNVQSFLCDFLKVICHPPSGS